MHTYGASGVMLGQARLSGTDREGEIELALCRPGMPADNALIEPFNVRLRKECLTGHRFLDLEDEGRIIKRWCPDYNELQPTVAR
jgi:putative transposase